MKHVITVFKKDLIDTLRDRRTIITMIIIPLLAIPLMISITTSIQKSQMQKARDKRLKVAVISNNNDITFESRLATSDDLVVLKELLEAGKIVPVIDRRYPLSEVPEAIRYLEEGHARGKVVITLDQNQNT